MRKKKRKHRFALILISLKLQLFRSIFTSHFTHCEWFIGLLYNDSSLHIFGRNSLWLYKVGPKSQERWIDLGVSAWYFCILSYLWYTRGEFSVVSFIIFLHEEGHQVRLIEPLYSLTRLTFDGTRCLIDLAVRRVPSDHLWKVQGCSIQVLAVNIHCFAI